MNAFRSLVCTTMLAGAVASAQNVAPPSSPDGALLPPVAPNAEMQKWLASVEAQWQPMFDRQVTAPCDVEMARAQQQYWSTIELNQATASSDGDLDMALMWRKERERFIAERNVPATDEEKMPWAMKQGRAAWRAWAAKIEKQRAEAAKVVFARFDQVLAQAQTQLTQQQRIDDALLVKSKREEIAAAWLKTPATLPTGKLAKLDLRDAEWAPLEPGQAVYTDRDQFRWVRVPESLAGFQFTRFKNKGTRTQFKVQTAGWVFLGVLDWPEQPPAKQRGNDIVSQAQLVEKGWKRLVEVQAAKTWVVFVRECKAGEKFSLDRGGDPAPILLVK